MLDKPLSSSDQKGVVGSDPFKSRKDCRTKLKLNRCTLRLSTPNRASRSIANLCEPILDSALTCHSKTMRFLAIVHRLLFVTALLGIVVGPMSIGAADSVMAASVSAEADKVAGTEMSGDMPCCPDEMPAKPGCGTKSCPLVLLCTTVIVGQVASTHPASLRVGWSAHRYLVHPHAELVSSLVYPPVRPPRV